jgi:phenylacetate-coenzyme A ligase PaaK-like adenylate-forming protein
MKTIVLYTMGVFQIQMSLFRNAQRKLDGDDNIPATVPARMEKIRCRKLEMVSLQRKSSLSTSGSSGSRTRQLSTSWDMKCEKTNLTRGLGDEVVGLDTYTALAKTMLLMMLWKKVRTRFQLLEFLT